MLMQTAPTLMTVPKPEPEAKPGGGARAGAEGLEKVPLFNQMVNPQWENYRHKMAIQQIPTVVSWSRMSWWSIEFKF